MDSRILELFNATLGMSIILITLILLRDFKNKYLAKTKGSGYHWYFLGQCYCIFNQRAD